MITVNTSQSSGVGEGQMPMLSGPEDNVTTYEALREGPGAGPRVR